VAISGGSGSFTYQWQSSPDGTTFTDIPNATALTYQPGALAVDTYYQRIVTSGSCISISNIVKITVQGELTGINISAGQTICYNTAPTKLIGETPAGGSGTFSYVWQKSTTSATNGFTDIVGATDVDYQPTGLTQTTYFRRTVTSGSCKGISNIVTIKVTPLFSLQQLPDLVICNNTAQNAVDFAADLNSPNISYKWINSETTIGLVASGDNAIPSFTATNTTKKPLIATITYKGTYTEDGTMCEAAARNFKITVLPTINITSNLSDITFCANISTSAIALSSDAESFTGAQVKYRWSSSLPIGLADGEGAEIPLFTTINTTDAPITSVITVIPLYIYGGKACEGTPKTFQITVNPAPKVNFSISNQVICSGSTSNELNLASATSNVAISWTAQPVAGITGMVLSGTDKIPAQTLINTTNAPITVVYLAQATTTGDAACAGISTEYKITVNPIPVVTATANNKTICNNERVNIALNSNVTGTKFIWTVSANTNVTGITDGKGDHINQLLFNTSVDPQMVTYTVTPIFENGQVNCNGTPIEIKVLVNPSPTVSFSTADIIICSNNTTAPVTLNSTTPNAKISWQAIVPTGISGIMTTSGSNTIPQETIQNTTNTPLTIVYKAVAKTDDANTCAGAEAIYKVVVNPVARLTNNKLEQNVCSGATSNEVVLQSNVVGATFSWTATASSTSVTGFMTSGSGNIPKQTLINTSTEVQKITYQISPSSYNCEGILAKYEIYVYPSPIFTSNQLKTEICSGKPFVYVPTSSSTGVTFTWSRAAIKGISNAASNGSGVDAAATINETLINTTINPINVTYEIQMSINGCTSGVKTPVVVTVNPPTTASFGLSEVTGCAPFNLVIKNLNSRALNSTYTVDFGDGSPLKVYNDTRDITHTYENDTKLVKLFYITITTKNECGEVISKPYEIRVQPQTVFSKLVLDASQTFGCAPFAVDFSTSNQSTGANRYTWDFGDGQPIQQTSTTTEKIVHLFDKPGNYTITLTATNGCSTIITTETVTVYPQVNTDFIIAVPQECINQSVQFTNLANPQFTSFWDFGDGQTSTAVNPSHKYSTPGLKTITLRSTQLYPNGGSCTAIATKTLLVLDAPSATFTTNASSLNCGPFVVTVKADDKNAVNVKWDFGDASSPDNITTGQTSSHTYTKGGNYIITATAYNAQGCTSTSTQIIKITEGPIAQFIPSMSEVCGTSGTLKFTNNSSYSGTDILNYKWYVNDNLVASSKDLTYSFNVPNAAVLPYIFNVKLEVSNIVGCKTVAIKAIQFNPLPKAVFTLSTNKGCVPFALDINNQSEYSDSFEWYLNNILVSTEKKPQIILDDYGKTYTIKLLAKNKYGCTISEQNLQATTYPFLKADFDIAETLSCNGLLNLSVKNNSVGATSYVWDFGDNSPIYTGKTPTHSYGNPGEYFLKLKVSNNFCTDEKVIKVVVSTSPKASFLADVKLGCSQLTVTFQNTSVNASDFLWDFGDGTYSKEINPIHNYVYSSKPYTVKLISKNKYGCEDIAIQNAYITVLPPPIGTIHINPNKIIKVPNYSFTFDVSSPENIINYRWDFGDGTFSDKKEIIHRYDRWGTYKVRLQITNAANCVNVLEEEVTILDVPGYLFIPNAFEPENPNQDLKIFKIKASGLATYQLKIFNKWGQLLWQTNLLSDDGVPLEYWDGKLKGEILPQGAYYWKAEATYINGGVWKGMKYQNNTETKTGVVHLIR